MVSAHDATVLDEHPFHAAVELLMARHGISADEARRRLEDVAENLGISGTELAELMLLRDRNDSDDS